MTLSTVQPRTILDVMALVFPRAFEGATWTAWRALLAALFALPMSEADLQVYQRCTGRQRPPEAPAKEAWLIVGRRGGKSRVAALLAVFLACFRRYTLAPGERGVVMVIATDRYQARIVFNYIVALLESTPMLARLIEGKPRVESVDLKNGISVEIHTASFRAIRGRTVVAAILDEIAFWPVDDAANPDAEILRALRPGMATIPGALLVPISSPYARRGELWHAYQRHHGKDGDPVLTWQADSRTMNPGLPASVVDEAYAADPEAAAAEYGAQFRRDLEAFVAREVIDACTVPGRFELPPLEAVSYVAFVDPSGGSSDSMTLALAHREDDRTLIDCVREARAPFSPDAVVTDFAATLQAYRVTSVTGDRYAGEWPREAFRKAGIAYALADRAKSDLYAALIPALNARRVDLLDVARLRAQLLGLERRTARGGRDSIDHAPGGHDDVANAVAGVVHQVRSGRAPGDLGITI